jgi:outer membrane protein TolC
MKYIMLLTMLTLSLWAMRFEQFKAYTLQHSPVLQQQRLGVDVARAQSGISLRTQNPELSLGGAQYTPESGKNGWGYTVSLTQPVRRGSYYEGLQAQAKANTLLANAYALEGKAGYLRQLESLYTAYVYQARLLKLLEEEYRLSQKVAGMVYKRYKSGSENRVAYLQAKTQSTMLKTKLYSARQTRDTLYYQLLAAAGLQKRVFLSTRFIYGVSKFVTPKGIRSPQEEILLAKEKLYQSKAKTAEGSFTQYALSTELEKEPDQSIFRVGISIPLSLHHDRSEERMLARLKSRQVSLERQQLKANLSNQKAMLKSAVRELSAQYHALLLLQKEQRELTALLQKGYTIAKGSLFELMVAKNRLIQTRKQLLETQKTLNEKKIALRYLTGAYND